MNTNKPRRNSNPGIFAGNIYISRPWSRRTSTTEEEIQHSKHNVIEEVQEQNCIKQQLQYLLTKT